MANLKNTTVDDNLELPQGTTAQRPASPQEGQIRYNTDTGTTEFYNGVNWRPLSDTHPEATGGTVYDLESGGTIYRIHAFTSVGSNTFSVTTQGEVEYLIVAGGGSGSGGGGGAGGVIAGSTEVTQQTYAITVGAGGSFKQPNSQNNGENGGDSSAFGLTAIGGGGGGEWADPGVSGGSGGGAGQRTNASGGAGISDQGNNGGSASGGGTDCPAGGGGGAGAAGEDAPCLGIPGNGGIGLYFGNVFGTTFGEIGWFAGGGGGGGRESGSQNRSKGGIGGGTGGEWDELYAEDALPNTGGGGGGGGYSTGNTNSFGSRYGIGGNGGSGIVLIRYQKNQSVTAAPNISQDLSHNRNPFDARASIIRTGLELELDARNSFGNTWKDLSGNGRDGALNGVDTDTGRHVWFDNPSDAIDFGTNFILPREKTLIFWLRTDRPLSSNDEWEIGFLDQGSTQGSMFGMMFGVGPTQDLGYWGYGSDYDLSIGSTGNKWLDSDVWNNVAVTMDSARAVRVYKNGTQQTLSRNSDGATADSFSMPLDTTNYFLINSRNSWSSGVNYVHLNNVLVYNRQLSQTEIQHNFEALRGRYGI